MEQMTTKEATKCFYYNTNLKKIVIPKFGNKKEAKLYFNQTKNIKHTFYPCIVNNRISAIEISDLYPNGRYLNIQHIKNMSFVWNQIYLHTLEFIDISSN